MQRVFVIDKLKQPLMPCHPARARALLNNGKAVVFRKFPMTIILTNRAGGQKQPLEVKLDQGSKTTGIAINLTGNKVKTIWGANLEHRGHQISEALINRRAIRRARRNRKTRYRQARFDNRAKSKGWLPPSVMSRVHNCETWVKKLMQFAPVHEFVVEVVRFDTQKMTNPDISGAEYQQGELAGYELREYLLFRDRHTCQYCHGSSRDLVLNIDHKQARTHGGSDRVKNLITACRSCNEAKGALSLTAWLEVEKRKQSQLAKARTLHIPKVIADKVTSLRDTAAVNAARYKLGSVLKQFGLPVTFASGGQTKFNRTKQSYPKDHWVDAACAGNSGANIFIPNQLKPLMISAKGHGTRQMCRVDKYGFPRTSAKQNSLVEGFRTGDLVLAIVPTGKKQGNYLGRVAVRSNGYFNITTARNTVQGINYKHCRLLQASDGYHYH